LLLSPCIVIPTAIIYGNPSLLSKNLDIQVDTIDLSNLLKALMCLYIGISVVWMLGVWKPQYWKGATQLNALFMLTLAAGRLLSILLDGLPTAGYVFGLVAELAIGSFAIYQLYRDK
ncbi:MAG: DUF4345 domain-containing protein, partial [Bacteroidota bacterium]